MLFGSMKEGSIFGSKSPWPFEINLPTNLKGTEGKTCYFVSTAAFTWPFCNSHSLINPAFLSKQLANKPDNPYPKKQTQ
jgi:hypothetical protein